MAQEEKPSVIKLELKRVDLQELVKIDDMLGTAPLFKSIGPEATTGLLTGAATRRVQGGQPVFQEGSPGTSLFLVLRGEVGLGRGQGAAAVELCTVSKGEFFGEAEVLGPSAKRSYTATAIGQADLAEFPSQLHRDGHRPGGPRRVPARATRRPLREALPALWPAARGA